MGKIAGMVGPKWGIMPRREKQYSDTKGSVQIVGRVVSGEKKRRIQKTEEMTNNGKSPSPVRRQSLPPRQTAEILDLQSTINRRGKPKKET